MKYSNNIKLATLLFLSMTFWGCSTAVDNEQALVGKLAKHNWDGYKAKQLKVESSALGDSDNDGVIDNRDKCQKTNVGVKVNNKGCANNVANLVPIKVQVNVDKNRQVSVKNKKAFNSLVTNKLKGSSNKNKFILIEGFVFSKGANRFIAPLSFDASRQIASLLVNQHGMDQNKIKVALDETKVLRLKHLTDKSNVNHVNIYIVEDESIQQVNWNVWSVELKGKSDAPNFNKRFINYSNLIGAGL